MDYDRTAARVAQENVERNHVEECVTTGVSDLLQSFTGKADLIIANIIADIVIRLFDELDAHLAEGGHLLASGIIDERVADVTEAALSHGFAIDKVIEESGWAATVSYTHLDVYKRQDLGYDPAEAQGRCRGIPR